jgi:formylglycine-generating enzyme required for sulfatase activity
MKRILPIGLLLTTIGMGYANEEITVELPGGVMMEFVWIEPGTFVMGTTEEQKQLLQSEEMWFDWLENELPAHEVTISKGFWLGKYVITQGQWESVMGTRPWYAQDYVQANANHPAVYISWNDVQKFIGKLNEAEGEEVYRLPTEAEWEYACRAGTTTLWSFGDDESLLGEYAWYRDNACGAEECYAHAVGQKRPNLWGLYDMYGNVWEWCQDWFSNDYYQSASRVDPPGPASGSEHVLRGGDFDSVAHAPRSARRAISAPPFRWGNHGARLLRMEPQLPSTVGPESWGKIKTDIR